MILTPKANDDTFTVEIGWSTLNRLPELSMRPSPEAPYEAFTREEYVCRLGALMGRSDYWWRVEKLSVTEAGRKITAAEARERLTPAVEAALTAVVDHGVPYLLAAAQRLSR